MKKYREQKQAKIIAIGLILINTIIGITANLATGVLPDSVKPYMWLSWPTLFIFVIIYIYLSQLKKKSPQKNAYRSKSIPCPYCLEDLPFDTEIAICPACESQIPSQYKKIYQAGKLYFVSTIGWAGGGKSMFFARVNDIAQKLSLVWPNYHARYGFTSNDRDDISDFSRIRNWPDVIASSIDQRASVILGFHNMPRWGTVNLVIRDFYGETLENDTEPRMQFLLKSDIVILFANIGDNLNSPIPSINTLLLQYTSLLNKWETQGTKVKRNLVVAITKADLIENLPSSLRDYVDIDPSFWKPEKSVQRFSRIVEYLQTNYIIPNLTDTNSYIQTMEQKSKDIEDWLRDSTDGKSLVRIINHFGINAKYSLVSIASKRSFDPILFVFELCNNMVNRTHS